MKDLMREMLENRGKLLDGDMTVVEWFDPVKPDHLAAYRTLRETGQWPMGFLSEDLDFPEGWAQSLSEKIVETLGSKKINEQEPDEEPDREEEEAPLIAQEEKPTSEVDLEKMYLGRVDDTHFYIVSDKNEAGVTEDLQVVDQEGSVILSAKEAGLDMGDVSKFILGAIQDEALKGAQLERSVVMQYLVPRIEQELEEPEDEMEPEMGGGGETPPGEEEEEEEQRIPRESRQNESKENLGMLIEDAKGNKFSVELIDEGAPDETVLAINGREFRFHPSMVKVFADNGRLTDESLQELALQTIQHMDDYDYAELIGQGVQEGTALGGAHIQDGSWQDSEGNKIRVIDSSSDELTVKDVESGRIYKMHLSELQDRFEHMAEARTARGRRDGTGPYKGSLRRKKTSVGRRKAAGQPCPKLGEAYGGAYYDLITNRAGKIGVMNMATGKLVSKWFDDEKQALDALVDIAAGVLSTTPKDSNNESKVNEQEVVKQHGKRYLPYTLYFPEKKNEVLRNLRDQGIRAVVYGKDPENVILVPEKDAEAAKQYFGESKMKKEGKVPQDSDSEDKKIKDLMEDDIPGGLADEKPELTVRPQEVEMGVEVEMEHTDNPRMAVEIALDHLAEDPEYYTKLKKMEGGAACPEGPVEDYDEGCGMKHARESKKHRRKVSEKNIRVGQLKEWLQDDLVTRNEALFSKLVPVQGAADTAEGELLRAVNRLAYRYFNDGDIFNRGYGIETAGPAYVFLSEKARALNIPQLQSALKQLDRTAWDEEQYEQALNTVTASVLDYVEGQEGNYSKNTEDLFDYEDKAIEMFGDPDEEDDLDNWEDDEYFEEDDWGGEEDEFDESKMKKEGKVPQDTDSEDKQIQTLYEGILELVGEIEGMSSEDADVVRKAVADGRIDAEWPSYEKMIDALSSLEDIVDPKTASKEPDIVRQAYLQYIIVPKAISMAESMDEETDLQGAENHFAKLLLMQLRKQKDRGEELSTEEEEMFNKLHQKLGSMIQNEGEDSNLVGSTKSIFKVKYLIDGDVEKDTRVEAFDEADAKQMLMRQKGVKKVLSTEPIGERKVKEEYNEEMDTSSDQGVTPDNYNEASTSPAPQAFPGDEAQWGDILGWMGAADEEGLISKLSDQLEEMRGVSTGHVSLDDFLDELYQDYQQAIGEGSFTSDEPVGEELKTYLAKAMVDAGVVEESIEDRKALRMAESLLGLPVASETIEEAVVGDTVQIVKRDNFEMVVEEAVIKQIHETKGVEITGSTIPDKQEWFSPKYYRVIKL